jgi:rod shape-determining protein MreD
VKRGARLALVVAALVLLHVSLRPRLGDGRFTPDFVLLALLLYAVRATPGAGAVAGFLVGLAVDAVAPTSFGAAALAHTVVGYLAGWLKAFVVAENAPMTALFMLVAAWLRDVIQVLASNQLAGGALVWQLLGYSPVAALTTGATALVLLLLLRGWLAPRPVR